MVLKQNVYLKLWIFRYDRYRADTEVAPTKRKKMYSLKRYFPIVIALIIVFIGALWTVHKKNSSKVQEKPFNIGTFTRTRGCARHPNFLAKLRVPQPVAIDLSQKRYKGLAFLYGRELNQAVHLKTWEEFDYFSTYALDPKGNIYLTPMPFVSVKEKTFEFQKNIYFLDSNSGNLSVWMSLDEVRATPNNPFGVIAVVYDCDDSTIWVSTIDESSYDKGRGVIYHIDIASKKILQSVKGVDALSLTLLKSSKGKFLLMGDARKSQLLAIEIREGRALDNPIKLLKLPNTLEHIRKIKVRGENLLELQTIPFSYTLIAQTSGEDDRRYYRAIWNSATLSWEIENK